MWVCNHLLLMDGMPTGFFRRFSFGEECICWSCRCIAGGTLGGGCGLTVGLVR